MLLVSPSRAAILDAAACMNRGGRYFVDVVFNKQPDSTPSSHILVDSVRKRCSPGPLSRVLTRLSMPSCRWA